MMKTADTLQTILGELSVIVYKTYASVRVPSSTPGTYYNVNVTKDFVTCECKGFAYRGKCKHVSAIKAAIGAK